MVSIRMNNQAWQIKGFVGEDWLLRKAHLHETRDTRGWLPATVPGSIQHDLFQAGLVPDPYQGMNSLALEWVPERTWLYKTNFVAPDELHGRRNELVFHGVDYSARYYLNDELIGQSAGMFLPVRFDVSDHLRYGTSNHLCIVIDPAPFEQPQIGYTSRVYTQKARMNYWWDFCPRMLHLGIWQGVELRSSGPVQLADVSVQTVLADHLGTAAVRVSARLDGGAPGSIQVHVYPENAPENGQTEEISFAADQDSFEIEFHLDQPALWWPNGAGEQPLYRVDLSVNTNDGASDEQSVMFGIRKIEFVKNEGAGEDALAYTLTVNGRRIYINGWNWVPMDVLYGVDRPEKRERLLLLAKNAHINLMRVWGGGLIEQEPFYQLCDRLGILVWQEFIQSSSGIDNFPSSDPDFIDFVVRNAQAAILGRRNHPSLAAWCGGNELHYASDRLCDDSHPALSALLETVQILDPGRQWFATSPSGGVFGFSSPDENVSAEQLHDVHGPWEYQGLREQYRLYNQGQSMLHSEFGVEGLTNQAALNAVIPQEQQWPVTLDNPIWLHLGAWWVKNAVWEEAWGPLPDVHAVQQATQFLQADGLRYAVEADRRRQFRNSGTMPWQFNEPYPMASCTSAVDYFAEPKPVYYAVARAYRPLSVTAAFETLAWRGEKAFRAEIWGSNTGEAQAAELQASITGPNGAIYHSLHQQVHLPENGSLILGSVSLPLASIASDYFILDLALRDASGHEIAANRYLFSRAENLAPLLSAAPAQVHAAVEKDELAWTIVLRNPSAQAALNIWLSAEKPDLRATQYAYFSDNYFCLLPGEERRITARWSGPAGGRALLVSGWNVTGQRLT